MIIAAIQIIPAAVEHKEKHIYTSRNKLTIKCCSGGGVPGDDRRQSRLSLYLVAGQHAAAHRGLLRPISTRNVTSTVPSAGHAESLHVVRAEHDHLPRGGGQHEAAQLGLQHAAHVGVRHAGGVGGHAVDVAGPRAAQRAQVHTRRLCVV